jgi:membrane-bound lytic murein transglycosylase B
MLPIDGNAVNKSIVFQLYCSLVCHVLKYNYFCQRFHSLWEVEVLEGGIVNECLKTLTFYIALFAGFALMTVVPARAATGEDFAVWLEGVRQEASAAGISAATIGSAFDDLVPLPRVIELDRRQPEVTRTFDAYLKSAVSQQRINQGKRLFKANVSVLEEIGARHGVPPRYLVALWGIESNYGGYTGGFSVIGALATLAYDGRRSSFFRAELLNALKIIDRGHIDTSNMTGSWAGAMGQVQFMPSSFLSFAVDYDDDGRVDIWNNIADALASAANYLKQAGWVPGVKWGRETKLPENFDMSFVSLDVKKSIDEWSRLGIRRVDGGALPTGTGISASIVQPDRPGRSFLVYDNFRVFLKWNRSVYFALAVGLLADALSCR